MDSETRKSVPKYSVGVRVARALVIAIGALSILLVAAVVFFNTSAGQRYAIERLSQTEFANGLTIKIGRVSGDLFGEAVLYDVVLSDPSGPFASMPRVEIDWAPTAWLNNRLDVSYLVVPETRVARLPKFRDRERDGPILPDFDIRIDRLELPRIYLASGIVGEASQIASLSGRAELDAGKVVARIDAALGSADRLLASIDARPDQDRFDLDLDYRAAANGLFARLLGAEADYRIRAGGQGSWTRWNGTAQVRRAGVAIGAFDLTNRQGVFNLRGNADFDAFTDGFARRLLGKNVTLDLTTQPRQRRFDTRLRLVSAALELNAEGIVDLAANQFDDVTSEAYLRQPNALGEDIRIEGGLANFTANGPIRAPVVNHKVRASSVTIGKIVASQVRQEGVLRFGRGGIDLQLDAAVASLVTGDPLLDPRLQNGRMTGTIRLAGSRLMSNGLKLRFPGSEADLNVEGSTRSGQYIVRGPVRLRDLALRDLGSATGSGRVLLTIPDNGAWSLRSQIDAVLSPVSNDVVRQLAGERIEARGGIALSRGSALSFQDLNIVAPLLSARLDGSVRRGETKLTGTGRHRNYGPFTVESTLTSEGPKAVIVLADPFPAAELRDVRLTLDPVQDGLAIAANGQSLLGAFTADGLLERGSRGGTDLRVDRLFVSDSVARGRLRLGGGGLDGNFAVSGGGLDGTIGLRPAANGQVFDVDLTARNARFGGANAFSIARGKIDAEGRLSSGIARLEGNLFAEGVTYGTLFLGRLAAQGEVTNGRGEVTASLSGRRGSRFNLQMNAGIAPNRLALAMRGEFAGRRIAMPRRLVATKTTDDGWRLSRSLVSYGDGGIVVSGRVGGGAGTNLQLALSKLPLGLADIAFRDLGLGGSVSGRIDYATQAGAPPTADFRLKIDDLTRSGLVLTSSPVDIALMGALGPRQLQARAVLADTLGGKGRVSFRISNLPSAGDLLARLRTGALQAQMRYNGQAEALWRLAAVDAFDITGPVQGIANARGSIANPIVRGTVSSTALRIQSSLSGTDVRDIDVRGRFSGSRLRLTKFVGEPQGGGSISGSGTIDFEGLGERVEGRGLEIRGPALDLRAFAKNARMVDANGLRATVTGPLRIVSSGLGGTIAGRVNIDRARWSLGTATETARLPRIPVREVNVRPQAERATAPRRPWRYLIDASGDNRIDVEGLGLDSEWSANLVIRGTTDEPRVGGRASVLQGTYSFAGTRFDLRRGEIAFDENEPIDPRLDMQAETDRDNITVLANVTGTALAPEINFSSTPALPEEEILARLLFGGSIADLSATDALQLGAAVASLRGGEGLDPINQLRSAIGLDRLRIVSADPALNRGTGVALGKNFGRRFYAEIITDGRGYSATELEFRVTSWLSLLAAVSTIGRESVVAEVSRDY